MVRGALSESSLSERTAHCALSAWRRWSCRRWELDAFGVGLRGSPPGEGMPAMSYFQIGDGQIALDDRIIAFAERRPVTPQGRDLSSPARFLPFVAALEKAPPTCRQSRCGSDLIEQPSGRPSTDRSRRKRWSGPAWALRLRPDRTASSADCHQQQGDKDFSERLVHDTFSFVPNRRDMHGSTPRSASSRSESRND